MTALLSAASFSLVSAAAERGALAWVFSEHAEITATALQQQEDSDKTRSLRGRLEKILDHVCWQRDGDGLHGKVGDCIPYSSLPALAADHSCSPQDLQDSLAQAFPHAVIDTADEFRKRQKTAGHGNSGKLDNRRWLDLRLRVADDRYKTRAGSNGSHFQLARRQINATLPVHLRETLRAGALVNSVGLYVNYHAAALKYARKAHAATLGSPDERQWAAWAFLSEALAQHFLQDSFAAGHMVGTEGGTADRIGTHDYYCEDGVEGRSWDGKQDYVAHGDAFMRSADLTRVVVAAERSFEQLAHAFYDDDGDLPDVLRHGLEALPRSPGVDAGFDTCVADGKMQNGLEDLADAAFVQEVVELWPIPAPADPTPPRFPAQLMGFIGAATETTGSFAWSTRGGPASYSVTGLLGVTLGLATEGISSRRMEGPIYGDIFLLGAEWRDGSAIMNLPVGFHLHAPFAILPGDGALFIPLAAFTSWSAPGWLAFQAATGSVYGGFERVHYRDHFTFQVVVGRDATLSFFRTKEHAKTEFDLLLPVLAVSQLPNLTLHTAFDWSAAIGFEYARRTQQPPENEVAPAGSVRVTDVYLGAYLAFFAQTRLYAP